LVLADGVFDPLHVGHLRYLHAAARFGSPLVVNIAPDEAIVAKGRKPFQNRLERATMILALGMVDGVRLLTLPEAIRTLAPKVLVKGHDWQHKLPDDVIVACTEMGTVMVFTQTQDRTSTERLRA